MEINATVNMDDLFDFENQDDSAEEAFKCLLQDAVKQAFREKFSSEIDLAMQDLMPKLVSTLELKLQEKIENFFEEDISISDRWGDPIFVGSIEDLMKQKFDETLLAPVNSKGEKVSGCVVKGTKTYAEYFLETRLEKERNSRLGEITNTLEERINEELRGQLTTITDDLIHNKVAASLAGILTANKD